MNNEQLYNSMVHAECNKDYHESQKEIALLRTELEKAFQAMNSAIGYLEGLDVGVNYRERLQKSMDSIEDTLG